MEVHAGLRHQRAEELLDEAHVEGLDDLALVVDVVDHEGAPAEVEGDLAERLVHREEHEAVAPDAPAVAERLVDAGAQHDAEVLDRVVVVDVEVARRGDLEVDQRMARENLHHVVQEGNTRRDGMAARAVKVD